MCEIDFTNLENAIEITNLTKKYDGFTLDNISFNVPKGTVMGFIGQNGAGKSTTIKAILNVMVRDGGSIKMLGLDNLEEERLIKEHIAVVFDEMSFHEMVTANQLNKIFKGLYLNWDEDTFFAYMDRFQLPRKKRISKYSKGMKMKLQITTALSHNAKLLIMDEATTGLDPVVRNEILGLFREYMKDETNSILMSSHITGDLDKIADCVTFIDHGRILLSGYKDEILENHGVIKCSLEDYKQIAKEDIISVRMTDYSAEVMVANKSECKKKYSGMLIEKTDLEEIMLFYVNREKKEWV